MGVLEFNEQEYLIRIAKYQSIASALINKIQILKFHFNSPSFSKFEVVPRNVDFKMIPLSS